MNKKIINYWPIFALGLLCLAFFGEFIINYDEIVFSPFSDLIDLTSFFRYFTYSSYEKHDEIPLWNPYIFGGTTYVGNLTSRLFYLPYIIFFFFKPDLIFGPLYIIHYFFAALSMYGLLRILKIGKFGSLAGAITYVFSGLLASYIYMGFPTMFIVIVAIPLSFLLLELAVQKKKYFYLTFLALLLALEFFGAHTQFFFYNISFLGFYLLLRTIFLIREEKKHIKNVYKMWLFFGISIILTVLLSAVQLLPALEFVNYGTRAEGVDYEFATGGSFPPKHIITFFMPNFFGSLLNDSYWGNYSYFSLYIYFGVLPTILAIIALLFSRNKYTIIFALFAIFSILFAFGKYSPLFYLFFKFVPGFNLFRLPARMLFFFFFSSSILAGFGTDFLSGKINLNFKNRIWLKRIVLILIIIIILSFSSLLFLYFTKPIITSFGKNLLIEKYSSSELTLEPLEFYLSKISLVFSEITKSIIIFILFLSSSAGLLIYRLSRKFNPNTFKVALVIIILIDLWLFALPYIDTKSPEELFKKTNVIKYLENDKSRYRVLDISNIKILPQHLTIRYSIEKADGYDPMILDDYYNYMATLSNITVKPTTTIPITQLLYPKLLDMLNIKYIATNKMLNNGGFDMVYNQTSYLYTHYASYFSSDEPLKDYPYEFRGKEKIYLYQNKNTLPRAYIVPNAIIQNRDLILDTIKSEDYDPKKYIILEKEIDKPLKNDADFKEVEISLYSPNKIELDLNMDKPGFLMLSEIWYPGWKAFDNGKETEIFRSNYLFRSIYLEEGNHKLIFSFEPQSYRLGKIISTITLIAVLFLLVFQFLIRGSKYQ